MSNSRNQNIGFIDTEEKTYNTTRDFKKNQIFIHPKYKHAVAIDSDILRQIAKTNEGNIKDWKIRFRIVNFEETEFTAEISLIDFLTKSEEFCFDKRKDGQNYTGYNTQRRLSIGEMTRIYDGQEVLRE